MNGRGWEAESSRLISEALRLKPKERRKVLKFREHGLPLRVPAAPSRNGECPCGSGRKYKRCCIRLEGGLWDAI